MISIVPSSKDAPADTLGAWVLVRDERTVYDEWNPVAQIDAVGVVVQRHLWGTDLSGTPQGAGGVGGLLGTWDNGATTLDGSGPGDGVARVWVCAYDGNGNVSAAIAATVAGGSGGSGSGVPGTVRVARYDYDAFGKTLATWGDGAVAESNRYRFSTKPEDGTGLLYYGYRYLDPRMGRWVSRDPIGERGGVNVFGYLRNDGLAQIDFLGLFDPSIPYLPDGVQPWNLPDPADAAARDAIDDFLNGTNNISRFYGPGHPWTIAMQAHEHMESIRNEIKGMICAYCSSDGGALSEVIGKPEPRPFQLNTLSWGANAKIYLRDIFSYAGFGAPVHGTGSVDFTFTISSINCSNVRNASVVFDAYDYLTISSAARIPKTEKTLMDLVLEMLWGSTISPTGLTLSELGQDLPKRPLRDWDNNSTNSPGNSIFLHWNWDEVIEE